LKVVSLVLLLLAFIAVMLVLLKRRGFPGEDTIWPYYAKGPMSHPEQVLYHRLVLSLPEHIVLAQVQVSRVLGVRKGFSFHEWNNRINRLSYDFVICSKDSTVLAAIELDDKSHESLSRTEADRKKERATSSAGVRLIRWHVKALPDRDAIKSAFAETRPLT
jgi:hypothetical protein